MSCFPVCLESLPQMSLQQDNAFKSPWKSTRPHAHGDAVLMGAVAQPCTLSQAQLVENAAQVGVLAQVARTGERDCLHLPAAS